MGFEVGDRLMGLGRAVANAAEVPAAVGGKIICAGKTVFAAAEKRPAGIPAPGFSSEGRTPGSACTAALDRIIIAHEREKDIPNRKRKHTLRLRLQALLVSQWPSCRARPTRRPCPRRPRRVCVLWAPQSRDAPPLFPRVRALTPASSSAPSAWLRKK